MNKNQIAFCHEYVNNGLNGTQAYLKAYKNVKKEETAKVNASRLLTNANVKEYIEHLQSKLRQKAIMTAEERMEWLTKVLKDEIKEKTIIFKTDSEGNTEEFEREIPTKLKTKITALDTLNKMTGEYVTKVEGNVGITKLEDVI